MIREESKRSGGIRRMAVLSPRDHEQWNRLAGHVALAVEPRLSPRVMGNRAVVEGATWRSAPLGRALETTRTAAVRLGRHWPLLVRTDVTSFYPSVDPSCLFRALVEAGVESAVTSAAADMLEGWGNEGYPGLPIGPLGSAVMANAMLHQVDEALGDVPFLRWVDDYLLGARSDRHAAQLLDRLDEALDRLGFRRSVSKTAILSGRPAAWPGCDTSLSR